MSTGKGYTGWKLIGAAIVFVALLIFSAGALITVADKLVHGQYSWPKIIGAITYGIAASGINLWWAKRKSRRATAS